MAFVENEQIGGGALASAMQRGEGADLDGRGGVRRPVALYDPVVDAGAREALACVVNERVEVRREDHSAAASDSSLDERRSRRRFSTACS